MPADTSPPTLKEVLRQKRAEYILQAAESIFAEKGYHDASMDEIAARAGVSKGTLYQHFPTKDELIFALIERNLALFEQIILLVSATPESAQSKLERILHAVHVEQHGMRMQLNRLLESNEDLHRKAQEHKGRLRARVDKAREEIGRIFEVGKAEGTFDNTISTELMVSTFLHLLSISKQARLFTEEHLSPEEAVAQMERLFFQGITRHTGKHREQNG